MSSKPKKRRKLSHHGAAEAITDAAQPAIGYETLVQRTKHNDTQTLLAKLPTEVKQTIWRLLLGDRVLHMKCGHGRFSHHPKPGQKPFSLRVCTQEVGLQEAYDHWIGKVNGPISICLATAAKHGHVTCGDFSFSAWGYRDDAPVPQHLPATAEDIQTTAAKEFRSSLNMLLVCSSLYTEVREILWGTSVFSLNDGDDLSHFVQACTRQQQLMLRRLHVCIDVSDDPYSAVQWQVCLPKCDIDRLKNLSELHVYLRVTKIPRSTNGSNVEMKVVEKSLDCFSDVQLRKVTVIIDHIDLGQNQNVPCITYSQQQEWASRLRQKLLNPVKSHGKSARGVSWVSHMN